MTNITPKPEHLAQLVFHTRGEKVLLDADLAMLYGVETGALSRAVTRNLDRFPDDFMFQLSREDWENLKCRIGISSALDCGIFCAFHKSSRVGAGETALD